MKSKKHKIKEKWVKPKLIESEMHITNGKSNKSSEATGGSSGLGIS